MAISEILGLDQQQAIDKVLTFSNSDYFKQYGCEGRIKSNYLSVDSLGGFDHNRPGHRFTLEDMKQGLEAVLGVMEKDPKAKLTNVMLLLYSPRNVKKRAGFTTEEGDNLSTDIHVSVNYDDEEGTYKFKVFSSRLREEKYGSQAEFKRLNKKYEKWLDEIRKEVAKCLEGNK